MKLPRLDLPKVSKPSRRTGVAAVELLALAPILVLVCAVSVDCGRFAYSYTAVCNAVRVAGQYGATGAYTSNTYSSWLSQVQSAALAEISQIPGFSANQWTLSVTTTTDSYGLFRVTVSGQYNFQPLLYWPGGAAVVPLCRQITIREYR